MNKKLFIIPIILLLIIAPVYAGFWDVLAKLFKPNIGKAFEAVSGYNCNPGQVIGDINGDGAVTKEDADITADVALGKVPLPSDLCCIDVNSDSIINVQDVVIISNIAAGTAESPGTCGGTTCTDSDGGKNYEVKGAVTDQYGTYTDTCLDPIKLVEYYCSSTGTAAKEVYECPGGCQNGGCIKEEKGFSIVDVGGYKAIYSSNEKIALKIKGVELSDNGPTAPDEGFNVQAYITEVPGSQVFWANGRYSNGYWYIDSAGPFDIGNYKLEIHLYCANDNAVCAQRYGKAAQVTKELSFEVTSATCTDSDGGKNYEVKGSVTDQYGTYTDTCLDPIKLVEYYCSSTGTAAKEVYVCPYGCKDGACIPSAVKEQVKCIFKNSASIQKCYTDDLKFSCDGIDSCVVDVSGEKGTKLTWKSTCEGYATTIIDGINEYAEFNCGTTLVCNPGQVIGDVNGDGAVTKQDADITADVALGKVARPSDLCCIDVNSDGIINVQDVVIISGIASGTIGSLGTCGEATEISSPLDSQISLTAGAFRIELDIPDYLDESLSHPQKFFAGRTIRLVKGAAENFPASVILSKRNSSTKKIISQKSVNVKKRVDNYFSLTIPEDADTGYYTIDFQIDGNEYLAPIVVEGLTSKEKSEISLQSSPSSPSLTSGSLISSISRLGCGICYWESVSGINPNDENYGYLKGIGGFLIQTNDGWQTTISSRIGSSAGDPKISFMQNNIFILSGLNSEYPRSCSIYRDSAPKNFPARLTETSFSSLLGSGSWTIACDYPKISVDNSQSSNYLGNIYVFANAVRFPDSQIGSGFFKITSSGEMSLKNLGVGGAISSTIIGPNGEIYAARLFPSIQTTPNILNSVKVSLDGGESFNEYPISIWNSNIGFCFSARVSLTSNRAWMLYGSPELAIDNNGRLYAAWAEYKSCVDDPNFEYQEYAYDYDVYVSFSDDRGVSWSNPVKVNDDNTDGDQGFPDIAVDNNGVIYVAFLDHRDNQDEAQYDVYLAYSLDRGLTFSRNIKVNDISIPNVYGHRNPGDYLDMLSVGSSRIFVSHPCINPAFDFTGMPNDACIAVIDKQMLSGQPVCGNSIAERGEVCDGTDLAGETCQTQGFSNGTLRCKADCTGFDTSLCTAKEVKVSCFDTSIKGDANNDGRVGVQDVILISRIILGWDALPSNICCIDLDDDGVITQKDVNITAQVYLEGLDLGTCTEAIPCDGCRADGTCVLAGNNVDGSYCDFDGSLKPKKANRELCINNFECSSNFCADGRCTSPGLWKKFIRWLGFT